MPGTAPPQHGVQGAWAQFQNLIGRVASLESWQRNARVVAAGTITRWGGASAPPGALHCDGSTFSATTYPALAQALGSTTLPNISGTPIYIIWT